MSQLLHTQFPMASVTVSEIRHLNGNSVPIADTLVHPFYTPTIADDGDEKYKYAEFKVSLK
jgi:hypothetical protein